MRTTGFGVPFALSYGAGLTCALCVLIYHSHYVRSVPRGVSDPSALYRVAVSRSTDDSPYALGSALSANELASLREALPASVKVAGYSGTTGVIQSARFAQRRVRMATVSSEYFSVIRAPVRLGGTGSGSSGSGNPVVISERFWKQGFRGLPDVVGERLQIDHGEAVVVGVVGNGFAGLDPEAEDLWVILPERAATDAERFFLTPVLRVERVGDLGLLESRLRDALQERGSRVAKLRLSPGDAARVDPASFQSRVSTGAMYFGFGALCIAMVNVLLLAWLRSLRRADSIRLRHAIGATPVRLMVEECRLPVILMATASVATPIVAHWLVGTIAHGRGLEPPPIGQSAPLLVLLVLATGSVAILGLTWLGIRRAMDAPRRVSGLTKSHGTLACAIVASHTFVIGTVATAIAPIAVGYARLSAINPGFTTADAFVVRAEAPPARPMTPERLTFALEQVRSLPFVAAAAVSAALSYTRTMSVPVSVGVQDESVLAHTFDVRGDFPAALGIRQATSPPLPDDRSVFINEALATRLGDDRVRGCLYLEDAHCRRIEALIPNFDVIALGERPQLVVMRFLTKPTTTAFFVIRMDHSFPARAIVQLQRDIASSLPGTLVEGVPLEALLDAQRAPARLMALSGLAMLGVSVTLAVIGLMTAMRHVVVVSRAELGICAAVGATPGRLILRLTRKFLLAAVLAGALGCTIGIVISASLTQADPSTRVAQFAAASAVLLAVWGFGLMPAMKVAHSQPARLIGVS